LANKKASRFQKALSDAREKLVF
jgi:hypothetical protein